jgi:hypothetical protein
MARQNLQTVMCAWLERAGCVHVKTLTGCIVLRKFGESAQWYVGSNGSVRYGRTRLDSHVADTRFYRLTGQWIVDLKSTRMMPDSQVKDLTI